MGTGWETLTLYTVSQFGKASLGSSHKKRGKMNEGVKEVLKRFATLLLPRCEEELCSWAKILWCKNNQLVKYMLISGSLRS